MFRGLCAFFVLITVTAVLGLPATLVSLFNRRGHYIMRVGRLWSRVNLAALGARVEYEGLEHTDARLPCLFMSNHLSNADIWALVRVLPLSTRFVAKRSLFRIPLLGWAMHLAGFISIDRKNRERAIASLAGAAAKVRTGISVVLFPEGRRSRNGALQPFKKGPFHLALEAGVPVVPVSISGSGRVLPPNSLRVTPGRIVVRFHPPIEVGPFQPGDHEGLSAAVRAEIATPSRATAPPVA